MLDIDASAVARDRFEGEVERRLPVERVVDADQDSLARIGGGKGEGVKPVGDLKIAVRGHVERDLNGDGRGDGGGGGGREEEEGA